MEQIGEILPYAREIPATEHGRASREAAWALNGRVLLFAERYERSAFFSKKVIDEKYFELDDDYNALFQSRSGNKEVIFEVMFDGINKGHACDNLFMPPSIDNGGALRRIRHKNWWTLMKCWTELRLTGIILYMPKIRIPDEINVWLQAL